MKIGIIGAMAQETAVLIENMTQYKMSQFQHLTIHEGCIANHNIILVQSGIGKVASAISATILKINYNVDVIINTGSAGSLSPNLKIGDVVVSTNCAYHDVDAVSFGYAYGQVPQMPKSYIADQTLVDAAMKALSLTDWNGVKGEIVSSDSFISSVEKIENIKAHFPNALCTEMEGASIAQTCHILNVPFVVIRAISDNANDAAAISFDEFIILAGKKSAQMVIAMLEVL